MGIEKLIDLLMPLVTTISGASSAFFATFLAMRKVSSDDRNTKESILLDAAKLANQNFINLIEQYRLLSEDALKMSKACKEELYEIRKQLDIIQRSEKELRTSNDILVISNKALDESNRALQKSNEDLQVTSLMLIDQNKELINQNMELIQQNALLKQQVEELDLVVKSLTAQLQKAREKPNYGNSKRNKGE